MILEYKDVQGFSIKEAAKGSVTELTISGLAFHSALAVKEIVARTDGNQMIVEVLLTPARQGLSGRFEYKVDIPPNVEAVAFGSERYSVWKRRL